VGTVYDPWEDSFHGGGRRGEGHLHPEQAWSARKGHTVKPHKLGLVLRADVDVLVIGNGVYGKLKITQAARKVVRKAGIEELIVEKTPDACATYNRLMREGKRVAFLAHGTC